MSDELEKVKKAIVAAENKIEAAEGGVFPSFVDTNDKKSTFLHDLEQKLHDLKDDRKRLESVNRTIETTTDVITKLEEIAVKQSEIAAKMEKLDIQDLDVASPISSHSYLSVWQEYKDSHRVVVAHNELRHTDPQLKLKKPDWFVSYNSEKEVQDTWVRLAEELKDNKEVSWTLHSTKSSYYLKLPSPHKTYKGKAPDLSATSVGIQRVSASNVAFIIDLKGKNKIDDDSRGQVALYAQILHQNQPRDKFYVILTDNVIMEVLKIEFEGANDKFGHVYIVVETTFDNPVYSAWDVLEFFLFASPHDLGLTEFVPVDLQKQFRIDGWLGCGACAYAYRAKHREHGSVVFKYYKNKEKGEETERDALKILASIEHVPKFVDSGAKYTLTTPIGTPFSYYSNVLSKQQAIQLINVLKEAHSLHLVHSDIALRNVFSVGVDILVNDWSSSQVSNDEKMMANDLINAVEVVKFMWAREEGRTLPIVKRVFVNMKKHAESRDYEAIIRDICTLHDDIV